MLSMTHSTESKEKKEIWGKQGADSGLGPSGVETYQGGSHPHSHTFVPDDMNWRASSLLEGIRAPSGAGHLPPSGHQTLAPTTKVNGRFQDTMPTTPENAS